MKILKPNNGERVIQIPKNCIYLQVTDYKSRFLLKRVKIAEGHHTWAWIPLKLDGEFDLTEFGEDRFFSFDNAINLAVNNLYATVYQFDNWEELCKEWNNIEYQNNITTVYKSEKE